MFYFLQHNEIYFNLKKENVKKTWKFYTQAKHEES